MWKAVSGVSHTWNSDFIDTERFGNETAHQYMNGGNLHSYEKMVCRGTAMNSTCDVPAPDRYVPDLRAIVSCQTFNMLNDSHGVQEIASIRGTVGVNELMVWYGMFLLLMYIMDGVLICFSNFVSNRSYVDITCALISGNDESHQVYSFVQMEVYELGSVVAHGWCFSRRTGALGMVFTACNVLICNLGGTYRD